MNKPAAACPVCDRHFEDEGQMRAHVLVNHHKSEIVDRLVEAEESAEREPIVTSSD